MRKTAAHEGECIFVSKAYAPNFVVSEYQSKITPAQLTFSFQRYLIGNLKSI